MIEKKPCYKENIHKMYQFLPEEFMYLTENKKTRYKDLNLKNDYIINIINELIMKYMFTNDLKFNLWSIILKKKYGKHYNYYFEYLKDIKFIFMVSNYFVGKKAKTYKINEKYLNHFKRTKITDTVLLKKYSKEFLSQNFLYFNKSPINENVRKKLVDDLYFVNLDYEKAYDFLNNLKENNNITYNKYLKNLNSIDSIKTGHIFFKFDNFGRMHTNFTILKKEIRNNFIKIDGKPTSEIDIKNSQPFFLSKLLYEEIGIENFNKECFRFIDLVKNGLFYEELINNLDIIKNREDAKILTYKVIFGGNSDNNESNISFRKIFPTVYEYISELKSLNNSYKEMSHALQKMESNFIYNKVISYIIEKFPDIKLFTIHDSIVYPLEYKVEVELIFKNFLKKELN